LLRCLNRWRLLLYLRLKCEYVNALSDSLTIDPLCYLRFS
jgi:hypothetical protein